MKKFDYTFLENYMYDMETLRLVSKIYQYKNKKYNMKALQKMNRICHIQSVYASNAIENVTISNARLKKLCTQQIKPKNEAEQIMKGYSDVLQIIEMKYKHIPLQTSFILQLHKDLYSYTTMPAGTFKDIQNYVNEEDENGISHTIFTPISPYETLEAMESICNCYNQCIIEDKIEPLILIPTFIHDFLCVHPFLHGSGKISRLLMNLLLYRSGYLIGEYVSLEDKILENKKVYYASLMKCHQHWQMEQVVDLDFIKFVLHIILDAYEELDHVMSLDISKLSAYDMVCHSIVHMSVFKKTDIVKCCPSISQKSIEVCLKKLVEQNKILKHGVGRATYYTHK